MSSDSDKSKEYAEARKAEEKKVRDLKQKTEVAKKKLVAEKKREAEHKAKETPKRMIGKKSKLTPSCLPYRKQADEV